MFDRCEDCLWTMAVDYLYPFHEWDATVFACQKCAYIRIYNRLNEDSYFIAYSAFAKIEPTAQELADKVARSWGAWANLSGQPLRRLLERALVAAYELQSE